MVGFIAAMRESGDEVALDFINGYVESLPDDERNEGLGKVFACLGAYFAHVVDSIPEAAAMFERIALHAARTGD